MKRFSLYTLFASILIGTTMIVTGCNSSRALTRKAVKLETEGLTADAAEKYYWALRKKNTNVDAQIGLKKAGQFVLNKWLSEFTEEKTFGKNEIAVYSFQEAKNFYNKVKSVGVTLHFPDYYAADFEAVKYRYIDELYADGTSLLEAGNFTNAETKFDKIATLDPNFKDTKTLRDIAFSEPLYQDGTEALNREKYRSAYKNFDQILNNLNYYKDATQLQEEALIAGTYPIAVLPFKNGTNRIGISETMSAYALTSLTEVDDIFIKVVDRDHFQAILNEQQLGMTGIFNDQTALTVGELTGAKAIFTGTVLEYSIVDENLIHTTKKGYEKYKVKKYNAATGTYNYITKYKPVNYTEYYANRTVSLSVQVKLVSLETGEILFTDIFKQTEQDQIEYVSYQGKKDKLLPTKNNAVNTSNYAYKKLQNKIKGRQTLQTESELANAVFDEEQKFVTRKITQILKEIIQ